MFDPFSVVRVEGRLHQHVRVWTRPVSEEMMRRVGLVPLLLLGLLVGCGTGDGGGGSGVTPSITSFTARPDTITAAGQAVTLSWTVSGAPTSLSISQGVGTVSGSSTTVNPDATTTYTFTATNSYGSDNDTVIVTLDATVPPPPPGVDGTPLPAPSASASIRTVPFKAMQTTLLPARTTRVLSRSRRAVLFMQRSITVIPAALRA